MARPFLFKLEKILEYRRQLEDQLADLKANLAEVQEHEDEARALLAKVESRK